ncbi:MAG: serine/threonine protein kinase [Oscillatoriales cyanobacterium C42_A2020_001]|nr:serine/threonine protein kinase [Leptolyngbyaceae cyanobacterium C42_A2020_001]
MVPPIPLGTLLRQRYLIQAILGQGGFGRTYLAVDQERFDERCVLKEFAVPYEDEALVQKSQTLFQREASTLYQIQHPQVPRFWAAFEDRQRLFLVQDFVDGQTYRHLLNERRQQGQTFSESEVCYFLDKMLPVLTYIHDRGIIHRDISPENIILKPQSAVGDSGSGLTETGLPVLIDFGAVKEATNHWPLTSAVTRVGKIGYAPPEQLQTGQVYPNSDLYSLAATCLALLTGKEPRLLLDSQTLEWRWQPYALVSAELTSILKRMLQVYPGDRYQSAQDVWQELQPLLDPKTFAQPALTSLDTERMGSIHPASLTSTLLNSNQSGSPTQLTGTSSSSSSRRSSNRSRLLSQPRSRLHPAKSKNLRFAMTAAFLLGTVLAGSLFWKLWTEPTNSGGEVWVSGEKLSQSEVSKIIQSHGNHSANSLLQSPSASPDFAAQRNVAMSAAPPQRVEFPPGKISTTLQGNLQTHNLQSYVLSAAQGQILTATLNGTGVVMNVLRSDQEGVDAAAYQTRSWTGQLPANDQYLIQISGSGGYTLDVAVTPTSRPTQEQTERVSFARGANGTTVTGSISSQQIRRYLLRAKQGQLVLVKVLQGKVSLSAIAPNGQRIGGTTTTSKDWKGSLPMDGDYVIEVSTAQPENYALSFEIF